MTKEQEEIVNLCKAVCGETAPIFAVEMAIACVERYANMIKHREAVEDIGYLPGTKEEKGCYDD